MKMANKKKSGCLWAFLIAVGVMVCAFLIFLQPIGDHLIIVDHLQKADIITAPSGAEYRAIYATELYKQGLAPTLFFTGGFSVKNDRSEADWSKYIATTTGVPGEAIAVDDSTVISTYDEAIRLKRYIDDHKLTVHSIIVVTDAYHTRRAKLAYQLVLGKDVKIMMAPVPFSLTPMSKYWWTNAVSRQFVAEEYLKYAYYELRYVQTSGPLKKWLSQFDKF
jgi:uncharacterized SAM-binding protein YcdF (DUF218 family)